MEPSMEYCLAQVLQKDVGKRLQVGQELIDYFSDKQKSADLEHDQTMLDKMVDGLATSWVNSSNYKVVLLGIDIISALVSRLQDRFKAQIGTVLPSLLDRLGDSKDSVREQDQTLLLKIMEQAANPQYVWDRMLGGFKHKNFRTREGICLCLIATLNASGAQSLTLSKIVPHICNLLGDPNSQVRDAAINSLVEIYRHVGERVRADLSKKGLPQSRLNVIFTKFDEVQKSGNMIQSSSASTPRDCSTEPSKAAPCLPWEMLHTSSRRRQELRKISKFIRCFWLRSSIAVCVCKLQRLLVSLDTGCLPVTEHFGLSKAIAVLKAGEDVTSANSTA